MLPYLVLLRAGFTVPRAVTRRAVRSYRTFSPLPAKVARTMSGGLFSVALSVGSRPPGVTWRPVRRSPDFPPQPKGCGDCLADSCFLGPAILHEPATPRCHFFRLVTAGTFRERQEPLIQVIAFCAGRGRDDPCNVPVRQMTPEFLEQPIDVDIGLGGDW